MAKLKLAQKFDDWLTPAQAVRRLEPVFGTDSHSFLVKHTLLEYLRGGKLLAMAGDTHVSSQGGEEHSEKLAKILKDQWLHIEPNSTLWTTGHVTFAMIEGQRAFERRRLTVRLYDVRFEPDGVDAMVPVSAATAEPASAGQPEQPKGKPVSEANLKLWADLYRKVYGGTEIDTLDFGVLSAKGMFPDKSVARDRVRDLIGGARKRGPKSGTAE